MEAEAEVAETLQEVLPEVAGETLPVEVETQIVVVAVAIPNPMRKQTIKKKLMR